MVVRSKPPSASDHALANLWVVAERARQRSALSRDDIRLVKETLPNSFAAFPDLKLPKSIRHPAGFSVSGAPVATFLRSALLIAGQKALGRRFGGHEFYETVERDLAFGIMRSHFHHGYPKGTHCCVQCTLAVYPVLRLGAIRYFEADALARDVEQLVKDHEWRFAGAVNAAMLRWSMGDSSM